MAGTGPHPARCPASLNQWQWLRSMLAARFRPDVHNQRRLAERCGSTPAETLDRFRAIITSTTAPSRHTAGYLGEVVVHAQDIRQPLGLVRTPSVDALTPVAGFFARRDFAVASRTQVAGLQLRADDGPFATGTGPLVTGSTLALVTSMAGRVAYLAELDGQACRPCGHVSKPPQSEPPLPAGLSMHDGRARYGGLRAAAEFGGGSEPASAGAGITKCRRGPATPAGPVLMAGDTAGILSGGRHPATGNAGYEHKGSQTGRNFRDRRRRYGACDS